MLDDKVQRGAAAANSRLTFVCALRCYVSLSLQARSTFSYNKSLSDKVAQRKKREREQSYRESENKRTNKPNIAGGETDKYGAETKTGFFLFVCVYFVLRCACTLSLLFFIMRCPLICLYRASCTRHSPSPSYYLSASACILQPATRKNEHKKS
jgi:hypothetical protein